MIRFLPDTWSDAVLRPLAMAMPNGGVYVEIMAPDLRFAALVFLLLLSMVVVAYGRWQQARGALIKPASQGSRALPALLVFTLLAFVVWLLTTGNGRYFIPVLLLAGPLCLALIYRLPASRSFRLLLAAGVLGLQTGVLWQNPPWHSWGLARWAEAPFFDITLDAQARSQPATYVTVTSISYSLVAPQFPAQSRWVNISSQPDPEKSAPGRKLQALLAASPRLMLLIPTLPKHMTAEGHPNSNISAVINDMLGIQHLALQDPRTCRLLPSKGLATQAFKNVQHLPRAMLKRFGFWVCPLQYFAGAAATRSSTAAVPTINPQIQRVFEAVEKTCPRFFKPGESATRAINGGFMRSYSSSDMKLYVRDDGTVQYHYWRALNPTVIGDQNAVLAPGFHMDCNNIRGRSGLPWEREI